VTRAAAIAKVHVARKQLGLDDESYRAILRRVTGKESAAFLSDFQLGIVIREFVRLGWNGSSDMRTGRTPTGRLIRALWRDTSREKSEMSLRSLIRRVLGLPDDLIPEPDMLSVADASKVIAAVKAMKKRER
jgi:hypothetical protein